ncbi:mitochondrial ribosomal protein [Poronia punctata]|nr:mitochondrial ribosomal protein [Poronia punctata]
MSGQRQTLPLKIYHNVTTLMNHRTLPAMRAQLPVWYKVMESIPPSEVVTRTIPPQHKAINPKKRRPSRLFQPQALVYEEDELRQQFYKEHPWELARPRMILEMDGKDAQRYDWSKGIVQPGMQLSGESVVQRQLWLMHNMQGMTRDKAYDIARREFYTLRHLEDVERRIAKEEALKMGAYFGKSHIQVGLENEDIEFEYWKKTAAKRLRMVQATQDSAYTNFGGLEEDEPASTEGEEPTEPVDEEDTTGPLKLADAKPSSM